MKREVRPIDANDLDLKIREYMSSFPNSPTRLAACRDVLSMLGDEGQTPTIADHFLDATKMGLLTLEQLREMDGQPVWITSVKKDGKIQSRWVLYSGKSESRDREDVYVFATTGGIAQGYKGAAYGKTWLAYDYPPAHIDREAWVSVNERMPDEDQSVIVIANGKPRENITLDGAFELAEWSERDGWFLECWPDWENPVVTHWMPIPVPPEEAERCAGTI